MFQTTRTKIYPHQVELHAKRQTEGLARFESGGGAEADGRGKEWKRFISYKGEAALPSEVTEPKVCSQYGKTSHVSNTFYLFIDLY